MNRFIKFYTAIVLCISIGAAGLTALAAEDTMYGIGSISKVFTAAAVMKLVDEGKLSLDTPVVSYMPEFTMNDTRYKDITPRMLLNHSAGLMGMTDNNSMLFGDNSTYNHDHFLALMAGQRLKHNPGERSIYTNDNFTLAEILVERVSGVSFTQFLEANFIAPLGLTNTKTPQSNFDRAQLAPISLNGVALLSENFNVIGSGGMYASMEDLSRFGEIFFDNADESVLSRNAIVEMSKNQHMNRVVDIDSDTTLNYGLGWDSVDTYPFNTLGIKALAKGGGTMFYHSNLTVLPEYELSVAVASSGKPQFEQLIAQEIALAVLQEEGFIDEMSLELPKQTTQSTTIPEEIKSNAGLYDIGQGGLMTVTFSEDTLFLSQVGTRNETPMEFIHTGNGAFVSTDGGYISLGLVYAQGGTRGTTTISFKDGYLVIQSYENCAGLSQRAYAMPFAQKIEQNPTNQDVAAVWQSRTQKDYLLVSETYSSAKYISAPIARIAMDDRAQGYILHGIYQSLGTMFPSAKILNQNTAQGYQNTPTMTGRDSNDLAFHVQNNFDCLTINNYRYIDAASALKSSEISGAVTLDKDAVWVHVDQVSGGQVWKIQTPQRGSYFVYDEKFNCVATSLEATQRAFVTLPQNGYISFVGEDVAFDIEKIQD